ncbi:hypothetical protein, partial [Streptomyces filamentosus]
MAIQVGSVEVDVVPNTRNIYARLRSGLTAPAEQVGTEMGNIIGRRVANSVAGAVRSGIQRGGQQASAAASRQGSDAGGTFGRTFRTRVEAAVRSLPDIVIGADTSEAESDIRALRSQLERLSTQRVGIDVDAATARRQVELVERQLRDLGRRHPNVDVRINTAAAIAELAALRTEINRLDGRDINIRVDPSINGFRLLTAAAVAFGPAILPVLPIVAAGLGSVAAAGTAAAVGLGALGLAAVPAIKDIAGALQAQKAAQDAANVSTNAGANAAARAQQKALQQEGAAQAVTAATESLANARRNLASSERDAARRIVDAETEVTRAREQAALVAEQAAVRAEDAARRVADAERALRDAQRDVLRVQEDLTRARQEAADQLRDLNERLSDAALDERGAVLRVQEAEAELTRVRKLGAKATELDRDRAQLGYDQAVEALADQRDEQSRLKAEVEQANRAGVDGSDSVRAAQERLQEAQQKVADRTVDVTDAQTEQARAAEQNARDIVEAEERVADAVEKVSEAQVQGAESVASAQRQVAAAQRQVASAQRQVASSYIETVPAVSAAATAQQKYQDALAKLTPAARDTMRSFEGLRTAFGGWSRSLQPAIMPIFTRALDGLKNSLPGLTPIVLAAADAVSGLQDRVSAGFKSPWWESFKEDFTDAVGPAIEGMGITFGRVFKGMAGVIQAFLPHMDSISQRMQDIGGRFADWGTNLKGSPAFERFLSYSSTMLPVVSTTLGQVFSALFAISQALAPITGQLLRGIGAIATTVQWLADNAPWVIQGIYGIVVAMGAWRLMMLAWRGAMLLAAAAMAAFNLVSMAGPWGWIALAIGAVVTAIFFLYTKCEWFRDAVRVVWKGIKDAAADVKAWFAGPFARFWTETLPGVFRAGWRLVQEWVLFPIRDFFTKTIPGWVRTLREKTVAGWNDMKAGLRDGWEQIKTQILFPIRDFFTKTIPGWGTSLKDKMVGAFEAAREGIKGAWNGLKKIARAPIQYVVDIVYNKGIVGVWNKVATAFGADELQEFRFARGGVMPGYTPGRDVHRFVSPTGGALELSGGEAIMRPEFTRAVGAGFVNSMNSIARSRGASGIKAALAPAFGGNPDMPTQRYADGGIFDWIGSGVNLVAGAGTAVWNGVKKGASWLKDGLEASARAGVNHVVDPLLRSFPGMDTALGQSIRRIPTRIIDALFGYSKEADKRGGGGLGGPKVQAALRWARTQNGLPYQWGGNGNPSWDCSGFMSAIESVLRGQDPHRRWSTMAFSGDTAPPGWVRGAASPFQIGITNAGVGHTAGTLGGVNVESRGGDGVIVGSRARGAKSSLFTDLYGFVPAASYDSGGFLQPGMNLAYNGTGRPEPVLTRAQFGALAKGSAGGGLGDMSLQVLIDGEPVRAIARAEIRSANGELIQV